APARVEELRDGVLLPSLDLRLERAPAREPMIARHRQQRRRELRARIGSPHLAQPILRELFQVFEGRAFGELGARHRPLPSIVARRPRLSGRKSGSVCSAIARRWVRPFTRTVGRLPALPAFYGKAPLAIDGLQLVG